MGRRTRMILIAIAAVICVCVGVLITFSVITAVNVKNEPLTVDQIVQSLKENTDFPQRVDPATTFDNVKAEPSAIHYFYTLDEGFWQNTTQTQIRESVMQGLCVDEASKEMLDSGIDLKYTYKLGGTDDTWDFEYTKGYCP